MDPTRMCALFVGLPGVVVIGGGRSDGWSGAGHVESPSRATFREGRGSRVWSKDRRQVELLDRACFGRPAQLVWRKRR